MALTVTVARYLFGLEVAALPLYLGSLLVLVYNSVFWLLFRRLSSRIEEPGLTEDASDLERQRDEVTARENTRREGVAQLKAQLAQTASARCSPCAICSDVLVTVMLSGVE